MKAAAANLEFEKAAALRDRIKQLRSRDLGLAGSRQLRGRPCSSNGSRRRSSRSRSTSGCSARSAAALVTRPFYFRDIVEQFDAIGVGSLTVVLLTGMFTGMVLALQSGFTLDQFGARSMVGRLVSASMVKELGPVLTGLMVAGRVGSGIAAELGSMMVTDQIAALRALGTDPIRKLVRAAHPRRPRHGAGPHRHRRARVGMVGGWIVTVDAAAVASSVYWNAVVAGPLHPGRVDGADQAVLPRLRHRQHRLPRRPAHARAAPRASAARRPTPSSPARWR